jgi:hypothetical protein
MFCEKKFPDMWGYVEEAPVQKFWGLLPSGIGSKTFRACIAAAWGL